MPITTIDRTAYNLLVDDSGNGNSGTVWAKSDVDDILTAVDGLFSNTSGIGINGPLSANGGLTANGTITANGIVTANGVTLGANGQIAFPATQNPSAGVNVLDDYEEGTWTPSITGSTSASGQVYSTQAGTYTKIGRLVVACGTVVLSTLGTITGTVAVGGLPFPIASGTAFQGGASIGYYSGLTTAITAMYARLAVGSSVIFLARNTGTAATFPTEMAQADFSSTTEIRVTAMYFTT
jgi:hypothetical protein